jgi:hypothetical protein
MPRRILEMSFLFQENNSTQASDFNFLAKGVTVWRAISICSIGIISFSRVLKRQVHLLNVHCRGMRQGSIMHNATVILFAWPREAALIQLEYPGCEELPIGHWLSNVNETGGVPFHQRGLFKPL